MKPIVAVVALAVLATVPAFAQEAPAQQQQRAQPRQPGTAANKPPANQNLAQTPGQSSQTKHTHGKSKNRAHAKQGTQGQAPGQNQPAAKPSQSNP